MLQQVRALRTELTGEAAESAAAAEAALRERPGPEAPEEEQRGWAKRTMDALTALLNRAPQAKALFDRAEKVLKPLLAG